MKNTLPCPICGAAPVRQFQAKHVTARKCGGCGHLYAASAAPMHGVQAHFDPAKECRQYAYRNVRLVTWLARQGFIHPQDRLLDVGAGAGHISMAIWSAFPAVHVTCVEADPLGRQWLESQNLTAVAHLSDCTGPFNAIYMIEVLEHLDDPVGVLKTLNKLLAPDGKLFITTPCGQTTSGRIVSEAYNTPEHIHFFTEKSLAKALTDAGFERPKFRTLRQMYQTRERPSLKDRAKDVARYLRAKILGQHQLITLVGKQQAG